MLQVLSLQPGTRGWNGTGTWSTGPRHQKQPGYAVKKAPLAPVSHPLLDPGMRLRHPQRRGITGPRGWGWWARGDGVEKRRRWGIIQRKNSFLIINFSALECDMLIHCEASNLGDKGPDNTSCAQLGWRSEPRQGGSI